MRLIQQIRPLLFHFSTTLRDLLEALGRGWCRFLHRGMINRSKVAYECPQCLRIHCYYWYSDAYFHHEMSVQGDLLKTWLANGFGREHHACVVCGSCSPALVLGLCQRCKVISRDRKLLTVSQG